MTAHLFSPITLGGLEFPNRIAVAPMCQYSADDGSATDWHLQHWMMYALSGAGMVTIEMTDVERRGRIRHGCLGLYWDANEAALKRALDAARRVARQDSQFGIQLAHAGRKASSQRPVGRLRALGPDEDPGRRFRPRLIPFGEGWQTPHALTRRRSEDDRRFAKRRTRRRPASTSSSCTARMATCCTSFSRRSPTSAAIPTGARWRTACGWSWRYRGGGRRCRA